MTRSSQFSSEAASKVSSIDPSKIEVASAQEVDSSIAGGTLPSSVDCIRKLKASPNTIGGNEERGVSSQTVNHPGDEVDISAKGTEMVGQRNAALVGTTSHQGNHDHTDVAIIESWQMIIPREDFELTILQKHALLEKNKKLRALNDGLRRELSTSLDDRIILKDQNNILQKMLSSIDGASSGKFRQLHDEQQCLERELNLIKQKMEDLESIRLDSHHPPNQLVQRKGLGWGLGVLYWEKCTGPTILERMECELRNKKKLVQRIGELEKEISDLRKEFEMEGKRYCSELAKAQREARSAAKDKSNLFQMLQFATTKRQSKATEGSFPDGNEIVKQMKRAQDSANTLFLDLVDLHAGENREKPTAAMYRAVFDEVILPCLTYASKLADSLIARKREQLRNLVENDELLQNRLVDLFWSSTMQKVIKQRIDTSESEIRWDPAFRDTHPNAQALQWAENDMISRNEETDGKNVGTLMRDFFHLHLLCEFSDPKCFLLPPVGRTVEFSSNRDMELVLQHSKKVREGAPVRVLYPALYFYHPSTDNAIEPVVKAAVVKL